MVRDSGQGRRIERCVFPDQRAKDQALRRQARRIGPGGDLSLEGGLARDGGDIGREDLVINGRRRGLVSRLERTLGRKQEGRGDLGLERQARLAEQRGVASLIGLGAAGLAQGLDGVRGQGRVLAAGQPRQGRDRGGRLPLAEREDDAAADVALGLIQRGKERLVGFVAGDPLQGVPRRISRFGLENEGREDGHGARAADEPEGPAGGHQSPRRGRALDELEERRLGFLSGLGVVLVGEDVGPEGASAAPTSAA